MTASRHRTILAVALAAPLLLATATAHARDFCFNS